MTFSKTTVAILLGVLMLAAPAGAQQNNAPPGNSGVDEYLETVPGASGNRPTTRDSDGSPLPAGARAKLQRQGSDGDAAAQLAERGGADSKRSVPQSLSDPTDNEGIIASLGRATTGSDDGMGIWLPILLILSAAGALAAVLWRRRRAQP